MNDALKKSIEALKSGGLILYPTDTIWGIGCDATNSSAVAKIYKLKQREDTKSMLVLIENQAWLNSYLEAVPEIAWDLIELADKPLTIIYSRARNFAPNLIASDGSIGIRVVKHAFCQQLIKAFRKPIVSTSANISGKSYPRGFNSIEAEILKGVDFIVPHQYDENPNSAPSSIIQLGIKGEIKVIRVC